MSQSISLRGNPRSAACAKIEYDNFGERRGMLRHPHVEKRTGKRCKGVHDLEQQLREQPIRLIVNRGQPRTEQSPFQAQAMATAIMANESGTANMLAGREVSETRWK